MRHRRLVLGLAASAFGLLIVISPALTIETTCRGTMSPSPRPQVNAYGVTAPDYLRTETNSVLSYPEWYLVYAYQDFAAVLHNGDEYRFNYLPAIGHYWSGLCAVNRAATAQGPIATDEKVMLYVIGISFTVEMAIKGAYESTIGHLFAWWRGLQKSNEDMQALALADDYAGFLDRQPWYQYPFWAQTKHLWRDVPFDHAHPARAVERRAALSSEWGVKALYAAVIAGAAGIEPAPLRIDTVVAGHDRADLANIPDLTVLAELGGHKLLIQTPRYAAFTRIILNLADKDWQILEIAGHGTIFATVLVPPEGISRATLPQTEIIFADPVQARPGWHRLGVELSVPALAATLNDFRKAGVVVEHLYDY
jgi:hypothetical protein